MKEEDAFIECAIVHNYQYGTLHKYIDERLNKGINVICDIDVQGFKLIKKTGIDHISIFIIPPSIEELEKRLLTRGLDSENVIDTRLENAKEELRCAEEFDYRVLKKEFSRIGIRFQRDLLCTIELSKVIFPDLESYSLGKLVSNFGIKINNRHRADGDAEATLDLFSIIKKNMGEKNLHKFINFQNE